MNKIERPLAGKSILVTRPLAQSKILNSLIKDKGGTPLSFPVITTRGTHISKETSVIKNLGSYQWIIFTSVNGVEFFFRSIKNEGLRAEDYRFAAVGEKTAQSLKQQGAASVLIPERYDAVSMVQTLKQHVKKGDQLLFPKGNLAPSYIKEELEGFARVDEWIVYETKPNEGLDWELPKKADCFFFLSPSAVTFLMDHPELKEKATLHAKPVFCIGSTTAKAAEEAGFQQVFQPDRFTVEDIVEKAAAYFRGGR
jgi:uroporphyrinogen-III synthase